MRNNTQHGFTAVELLVYIVGMTIVLAAISYFTMQVYGLYRSATTESRVDRVASTLTQVLASEMRAGETIDQSESVFNAPLGTLTIDAREGESEVTKSFTISDGQVIFTEAGTESELTPADMSVSQFLFTQITTPISYAVRYEVAITFTQDDELVTKTYPGLVILRHSYE